MTADVYQNCPDYENEHYLLRLVKIEDKADLLKVYSDEKAVPFFNSDNCGGDDFHYTTESRMEQHNGPPVKTTHEKIIMNQIIPYQPILSPEPPCYRSAQRNCPAEQGCLDRMGLAGTMSQVRCPQLLNPLRTLAAAAQPARTRLSRSVACDAKQLW